MRIILKICHQCDHMALDNIERLLSIAIGVGEVAVCLSCRNKNSSLTIHLNIPEESSK